MKRSRKISSDDPEAAGDASALRNALFEGRYDAAFQLARALREKYGERTPPGILYAGACALFGLGHILQAEEWVELHGTATMYRADHLYLAAYIELHKERGERALLYWTRIVQDDPSQTFADALIEKIKKGEDRVRLDLAQPGAFLRYVPLDAIDKPTKHPSKKSSLSSAPPSRRLFSGWRWLHRSGADGEGEQTRDTFWWLLAGIVLLSALSIGFGVYFNKILGLFAPDPYAAALEDLPDVPGNGTVIQADAYTEDAPRFVYPDKDAAFAEYREARVKIGDGFPNQARYLLGRLELSNASFEIKERARLLRDAIPRVRSSDFRDPLEVDSILEEPYMYRDAQVLWQGEIQNVRRSDTGVGFDLFVPRARKSAVASESEAGEDTEPAPAGEARVSVGVLYLFQPGDPAEVRELADGQSVRVFGSVIKTSNGRITVQAAELR